MLVFLDIDGVLVLQGRGFDPSLVMNLNWLIAESGHKCEIILNTAWNAHTIQEMQVFMIKAGFKHSDILVGQTNGCSGGGLLIQEWLKNNNRMGEPYVILDDSTKKIGAMWSRLARCNADEGFTKDVAKRALKIMQRRITEDGERKAACKGILKNVLRVQQANWLTPRQKSTFVCEEMELIAKCITDPFFLQSACLSTEDPKQSMVTFL